MVLASPFGSRCLSIPTRAPFLSPAHRTSREDSPHPIIIQEIHAFAHETVRANRGNLQKMLHAAKGPCRPCKASTTKHNRKGFGALLPRVALRGGTADKVMG